MHRWIGALDRDLDLVVTLDDATGDSSDSALLVEQEGTVSSFHGLRETIHAHGLFAAFYTDRGSHDFLTPKAGAESGQAPADAGGPGAVATGHPPHPSYSPRPRDGWSGVRHAATASAAGAAPRWVASKEQANIYLRETFVPAYNSRFGKPAAEEGTAFVACTGAPLRDVLSCRWTARSDATTACPGRASRCRSRLSGIASIMSVRRCGCTNIRTLRWRFSTVHDAWSATMRPGPRLSRRCQMRRRRPARSRVASCSPASRTLRAAAGAGLRHSLTQPAPAASIVSGRDGKTALQPNRKTTMPRRGSRTVGRSIRRTSLRATDRPDAERCSRSLCGRAEFARHVGYLSACR